MVNMTFATLTLFLIAGPVAAESRFLFDSTGHSATIVQPSPKGPALYFDSRGNMGTIQQPLPNGPIFYNFQSSPGQDIARETMIRPTLAPSVGGPRPMQPTQSMPSMTPYGMQP